MILRTLCVKVIPIGFCIASVLKIGSAEYNFFLKFVLDSIMSAVPSNKSNLDNSKRFRGLMYTLIGGIGCILTSPFLVLGGTIGFIYGKVTNSSGAALLGATIGSFGSLLLLFWGLELTKATAETNKNVGSKVNQQEKPDPSPDDEHQAKGQINSNASPAFFTPLKNPLVEPQKTTKPVDTKKIEKFEKFIKEINDMVIEKESQKSAKPPKEDIPASVTDTFIQVLIDSTKQSSSPKHEFLERLDQMNHKDLQLLVSKLNHNKEKGKFSSSDLDYFWRQFLVEEFEPLLREKKRNKLAEILELLSDEQLTASFESADFLNMLHQDVFAEAVANTLNHKQIGLFASDTKRHGPLDEMIKKLKPSPELFTKLVAIMPYVTLDLRISLEKQFIHMPGKPSFKIKLTKLLEYYLAKNYQTDINNKNPDINKKEKVPSKWATINISASVYKTEPVEKKEWSEEAFDKFTQDLNATTYMTHLESINEDLNTMSDNRIKMLVEKAALPEFKDLLNHLWEVESKTTNHNSYVIARMERLTVVLENLSEDQLNSSITQNKFWEIFRNTQQPFCEMAAEVLTPQQFKTIISQETLDRHTDLAKIINFLKKDTPEDKKRLDEVIKVLLPHTTPWLAPVLELKIKDLLDKDKTHLNTDLKKYLQEAMANEEVILKYGKDMELNKNAISNLLQSGSDSEPQAPTFRM